MGSKIGIRIISISLALFLLGLFFPGQAKATISVDSQDNPIQFGDVAIDSEKTISVGIKNENETAAIKLYFRLESGDTCGFSFDVNAQQQDVLPGEVGYVDVTYTPSELIPCSGSLIVLYIGGGLYGNLPVPLEGMGVPSAPSTVMIDGYDTGVENGLYKDKAISEWLDDCAGAARNHGEYVRCVALLTRNMKKAELLNRQERRTIVKAAAHANIPPRKSGLEALEYNGELVTDLINECKDNANTRREYRRCIRDLIKELKQEDVIKTRKEKHQIRRYAARLRFHGRHSR
jgi:hypothetical protein